MRVKVCKGYKTRNRYSINFKYLVRNILIKLQAYQMISLPFNYIIKVNSVTNIF